MLKALLGRLKPLLRWVILGATLFFLATVLRQHWSEVAAVRVDAAGWSALAIALGLTLLAHIAAGWVWSRILHDFRQPVEPIGIMQAYLQTTIAKYLPGNVWHYYGRVTAATKAGASLGAATVSVLLEPLLMLAAALLVTLLASQQIAGRYGEGAIALQWIALIGVLAAVHPRALNPLLRRLYRLKQQAAADTPPGFQLTHYPLVPLWGELGFLLLRASGFLLAFQAIQPIALPEVPLLVSVFSLAWLLGLVIPGAPGGVGVFEATAIALLDRLYAPGLLLIIVAFYRLISVLAEAAGAGLAWVDARHPI